MKNRAILTTLCLVTAVALTLVPAGAAPRSLASIDPGQPASLQEDVLVRYVFVGYDEDRVNEVGFLSRLPAEYRPVVRSRLWYDVVEELGITQTFDHRVTYTDAAWEDAFFTSLAALGAPAPLTQPQKKYNKQQSNVLDIPTDGNLFIDAPSVEKLLIDTAPAGVDTERYTVFFINWFGRDDFRFHVYTKTGEPDPDTGYDFGLNRASRKIIAWGGTTPDDEETGLGSRGINRVWFYDLSAGPEAWTTNWVVDTQNLYGTDAVEYRMPPIWEYDTDGFRNPGRLTGDLAKVARYVAIDLLFTTSPTYPPALTPPESPGSINLDLNTVNGWPVADVDPSVEYQDIPFLLDELGELDPLAYSADTENLPFQGTARSCFVRTFAEHPRRCYPDRSQYPAFANLFLDTALNRDARIDGSADYEGIHMNYATSDYPTPLGFADDNWLDGTQSFVFNFVSPGIVDAGYGLTTTQIHEFGHHIGMSHPHDGFDWEEMRDFGPGRDRFFAWSGDQSNTIMSYIDVNWDFSQFDRDNFNRFRTAAYLTNASAIAVDVLASPDAGAAAAALALADSEAEMAEASFTAHDYPSAQTHARASFEAMLLAADLANVTVESSEIGWFVQRPPTDGSTINKAEYAFVDMYSRIDRRALP